MGKKYHLSHDTHSIAVNRVGSRDLLSYFISEIIAKIETH